MKRKHLFRSLLAAALAVLTNAVKQTKKLHPIVFILVSAAVGALFRLAE